MKKIILLVALFWYGLMPWRAYAQATPTQFYIHVVYDDGTPDAGGGLTVQEAGANLLGVTLDANGRWQGAVPVNPAALHAGNISYIDANGLPQLSSFTQVPCPANAAGADSCAVPFLQLASSVEFEIVITRATGYPAVTLGPVPAPPPPMLLPQTKLAGCASSPAFGAAPNSPGNKTVTSDAGGGAIIDYAAAGETFDCQVNVPATGIYALNIRAETPNSSEPGHFEFPSGTKIGTACSITKTISAWGQPEKFQTFACGTASLPQGAVTLRYVNDAPKWSLNLNWFN